MRGNLRKSAIIFLKNFYFAVKSAKIRNEILEHILFMSQQQTSEITQILQDWNDGNEAAKEQLLPFVYEELKRQRVF